MNQMNIEINRKSDEMLKMQSKIIDDNKITHEKLNEVKEELVETNEQLEDVSDELIDIKIKVTNVKPNIVPSDDYEIIMLFKVNDRSVNIHRGSIKDRYKFIKRNENLEILYDKKTPNGVELFQTFKLEYGNLRSKVTINTKFVHKNNHCELVNDTTMTELINLLEQHLINRVETKLN